MWDDKKVEVGRIDLTGEDVTPEQLEAFKKVWLEAFKETQFDPVPVRFVRTHPQAQLPTRGTAGAVGWDLYAALDSDEFIAPGGRKLISTGWNIAVPDGYEAQVRSRSGLALKNGVFVLNSPGTIDPDYRGSLGVILHNSDRDVGYVVKPGARIAQLVVAPVMSAAMIEVEAFNDETARGTGGYGHTGV